MQQEILSRTAEELIVMYHEINKELASHLLNGDAWNEQQDRILMLNEISKELTRRKVPLEHDRNIDPEG
jgi:hypothetical protein